MISLITRLRVHPAQLLLPLGLSIGLSIRAEGMSTLDSLWVCSVKVNGRAVKPDSGSITAGLRDRLTLTVPNLPHAIDSEHLDPATLVLYLDGHPLTGVVPVLVSPARDEIEVELVRNSQNVDTWRALYESHGIGAALVRLGVGRDLKGESPRPAAVHDVTVNLNAVPAIAAFFGGLAALLVACLTIFLAYKRNMLRESPSTGDAEKRGDQPPTRLPYSLGWVQMAFWTVLVVGGFVFIAVATGEWRGVITDDALTLIGFGSGTALGSMAIRVQKKKASLRQLRDVAADLEFAESLAGAAHLNVGADTELFSTAARRFRGRIQTLLGRMGKPSQGDFWTDILTDEDGIGFHRFQLVVWTLVIGTLFCIKLVQGLSFPVFDKTLLALLGVSGGTYLGFKIPEVHAVVPAHTAAPVPQNRFGEYVGPRARL
jgi:hypothetical protein